MALAVAGLAAGCTGVPQIVTQHFAYTPVQKLDRQWRAELAALDACHSQGYQEADPVGTARAICDRQDVQGCSHFKAVQAYACRGMGYQQN